MRNTIEVMAKDENNNDWCVYIDDDLNKIKMIKPREKVIKEDKIEITFNYPLNRDFKFTFKNKNGFTRKKLFKCIQETYRQIYKDEDAVSEPCPMKNGIINRGFSDGPYGIWGHVIGDLVIEGVKKEAKGKYSLCVGS